MEAVSELFTPYLARRFDVHDDVLRGLDTADIVLFSGTTLSSFIVREFVDTRWSHIGMVVRPDKYAHDLPEHSCDRQHEPGVQVDETGNMIMHNSKSPDSVVLIENYVEDCLEEDAAEEEEEEERRSYAYETTLPRRDRRRHRKARLSRQKNTNRAQRLQNFHYRHGSDANQHTVTRTDGTVLCFVRNGVNVGRTDSEESENDDSVSPHDPGDDGDSDDDDEHRSMKLRWAVPRQNNTDDHQHGHAHRRHADSRQHRRRQRPKQREFFSQTPEISEQLRKNREECPYFHAWKNGEQRTEICFRCLIERYHNVPLLLESVRGAKDGLLDLLTAMNRTDGVRLVSLCERILSARIYQNIGFRKLLGADMHRDLRFDLRPDRKSAERFQRNLVSEVLPAVCGKDFEASSLAMVRSWFEPIPCGSNPEDESTLFCSELVAMAYKRMGLLEKDTPCSRYTPRHFSQKFDPPLEFYQKAYLSDEFLLIPKGEE